MARTFAHAALGTLAGSAIAVAIAGSAILTACDRIESAPPATPAAAAENAESAAVNPPAPTALPAEEPSDEPHSRFAKLAEQAAPGVVNVHTSRTVTNSPQE